MSLLLEIIMQVMLFRYLHVHAHVMYTGCEHTYTHCQYLFIAAVAIRARACRVSRATIVAPLTPVLIASVATVEAV